MNNADPTHAGTTTAVPAATDGAVGPQLGGTYRLIKTVGEGAYGVV